MLRLIVARCYRDYSLKRLSQADLVLSFCGFELVPLLRGEADDVCGDATLVIGLLGVKYSQKLAFSLYRTHSACGSLHAWYASRS
jgi:hypothetical protein